MRLFYINPKDAEELNLWFIVETLIIFANYPLLAAFIWVTLRVRVHINIKILTLYICPQFAVFLTARLLILAKQSGLFAPDTAQSDPTALVMICSLYKSYYLLLILTFIFWLSIEREFAMHYIRDYEKRPRKWIPVAIIVCATLFCSFGSAAYTFQWLHWLAVAIGGFVVLVLGALLFMNSYRNTLLLYNAVKNLRDCNHQYSLSLRFQLAENIWCGKLLRNGCISIAAMNCITFAAFVGAYWPYFEEERKQLLDCFFNIFIALNGPLMGAGGLCCNPYLWSVLKSIVCGSQPKYAQEDHGNVYFIELERQWNGPVARKNGVVQRRCSLRRKPQRNEVTI